MNYKELERIAKIGVRFQDNVIDADFYVFDEIRAVQQKGERRIGLGTMGIGDALIKMKLRYGSQESLIEIDKIYKTIRDAAYEASVDIAKEKVRFLKLIRQSMWKGTLPSNCLRSYEKDEKIWCTK